MPDMRLGTVSEVGEPRENWESTGSGQCPGGSRYCLMVLRKWLFSKNKKFLVKACIFSFIEHIYGLSGLPEEDDKRPWHQPQHLLFPILV